MPNFKLKISETNILKNKINRAFGNSFRAGVRLRLNDNWKTNFQLKYDRYHNAFEHIRELASEINLQRLVRIYTYEETFHNNYTNTLGGQLGLERRWQVADKLKLYAGIGVTPTYTLSSTGKTTTETIVEPLTFDDQIGKFSMSGNLNVGIIIPINKFVNIEAAYQYNRLFANSIFINNDIQTNQQNAASLMVSYRLIR